MTSSVPEGIDEAVEAAGDALVAYYRDMGMPYRAGIPRPYAGAKLAVAAAAPYIAAKALRDAADELTRDCDRRCTDGDCADHAVWLTERADDIERAVREGAKT